MNVSAILRRVNTKTGMKGIVYFRIYDKGSVDFRVSSNISVQPEYWDNSVPGYSQSTPHFIIPASQRQMVNKRISEALVRITSALHNVESIDANWLSAMLLSQNLRGDNSKPMPKPKSNPQTKQNVKIASKGAKTLLEYFAQYLEESTFNDWHRQAQTSVMHRLERYEKWIGKKTGNPDYKLRLHDMDKSQVEDYADYMEHEHEYYAAEPEFYSQFNIRNPKHIRPVSRNSISSGIKRLFMFLNWAVTKGYLKDVSFRNVSCEQQAYGTPYYLTIEERDKIMEFDLSDYPRLELHRDKFIFQCLVGCRSNDLELFTWNHIIGDFIEYIPHKNLLAGRTETVRVPLCDKAKDILESIDPEAEYLFKYFCTDLYRQDIKKILKLAGIDRLVTVINPLTRKAERLPLCECASSHLARRTFIGNLYKKVKDPALISALTGHTETSTSFTRYRSIDDDIKRDILDLIE